MFDLVVSTYTVEDVLKKRKERKWCNLIVNIGVESLNKEDRSADRARSMSTKEMQLNYMEHDSGLVLSAKQRGYLDVWLQWIGAMLSLNREKGI